MYHLCYHDNILITGTSAVNSFSDTSIDTSGNASGLKIKRRSSICYIIIYFTFNLFYNEYKVAYSGYGISY